MKEQRIVIPRYITHVKLSESRRPKYYPEFSRIPAEFSDTSRYIFKNKEFKHYSKKLLYDKLKKQFVVKNHSFVGQPRYIPIGGNMVYAGMNEHVRVKIVNAIKDDFRPVIEKVAPLGMSDFPIQIDAELHALPKMRNWDLDNLWIYIKSFQDLLTDYKIIPEDCIRFITKAPSFEYFPVTEDSDRKMIFILRPDKRIVTNHVMFRSTPASLLQYKGQFRSLEPVIFLSVADMPSGDTIIEKAGSHFKVSMGLGKRKLLYKKFAESLVTVRYWAIQYNAAVVIDNNMCTEYPNYNRDIFEKLIENNLCQDGIQVIIHNL